MPRKVVKWKIAVHEGFMVGAQAGKAYGSLLKKRRRVRRLEQTQRIEGEGQSLHRPLCR